MLQMFLKSQQENSLMREQMMQKNFDLQMEMMKMQSEALNKNSKLMESLTQILPSVLPSLMKKFLPET